MQTLTVGDIHVVPLLDGTARLNAAMFTNPDASPANWTPYKDQVDEAGDFVVPVGAYLIRTGDRLVLFDAGVGDVSNDMFVGGQLLDSLANAGAAPVDIDTVIISHLHSDHMGWLEHGRTPVFTSADIWVGAADWEHYVGNEAGGEDRAQSLRVVEDQVNLIDSDELTIAPGVTTCHTPGHTPGHTSAVIADAGERLIMMGDVVHCPTQLHEAEWQFFFDVDRTLASRTRAALLHEAEEPHTTLLPCHFPDMAGARLVRATDGQKRWVF